MPKQLSRICLLMVHHGQCMSHAVNLTAALAVPSLALSSFVVMVGTTVGVTPVHVGMSCHYCTATN